VGGVVTAARPVQSARPVGAGLTCRTRVFWAGLDTGPCGLPAVHSATHSCPDGHHGWTPLCADCAALTGIPGKVRGCNICGAPITITLLPLTP
jgi:hypothetical protein